jgi:hypothetical protein
MQTISSAALRHYLENHQPEFVREFERISKEAVRMGRRDIRSSLEILWEKHNSLLGIAERLAALNVATAVTMSEVIRSEVDKRIESKESTTKRRT